VIALLIAIVVVAVLMGLAFAIGGVVLPILLVLAGLVVVGWRLLAGVSRRTPSEVAERAHEQEFLGPGGPDDPRR
jgi:membrane protein implicated in regulation of membrane protease activity